MFLKHILIFVNVILLINGAVNKECEHKGSSRSPSSKIKERILCNYDKDNRPVKDQSKAIDVNVRLVVKSIDVMDTDNEFDMHNWMGLIWKDEYLVWDPNEFNSVKSIHISSGDIWVPDLKIFKDHDTSSKAMTETEACLLKYTGVISCVTDNMHGALCTRNTDKWPYDTRLCTLRYTTGVYNSSQIRLTQRLIMSVYFENPEWKLLNSSAQVVLTKNPVDNGTYYNIKYNFKMERHSARVIAIIYVPAFSLITLTLLPLWMKPGNVERFCLVASNIFSHFLFIQHIEYVVPLTGNNLPRIVSFFRDSLGIAVIVLIELTLIKSLVGNRKSEAPKWLLGPCKFLSTGVIGRGLLIDETSNNTTNVIANEDTSTSTNTNIIAVGNENENHKEATMDKEKKEAEKYLIATIIDRVVFALFAVVYFILVLCLIPL